MIELELDDVNFKRYCRLNKQQFGIVLSCIEEEITKHSPCCERLAGAVVWSAPSIRCHKLKFKFHTIKSFFIDT